MATRLSNALRRRLDYLSEVLKEEIQSRAPQHLRDAVETSVHSIDNATAYIKVEVDASRTEEKYGHGDARAREFGSGLHAQIGETGYYPIIAKNAEALVFAGTHEWEGQTIVMIPPNHVNHPGVEAANDGEGYIRPALHEFEDRLVPQLDPDIKEEVDITFRMAFPHAKRVGGLFSG